VGGIGGAPLLSKHPRFFDKSDGYPDDTAALVKFGGGLGGDPYHSSAQELVDKADDYPDNAAGLDHYHPSTQEVYPVHAISTTWKCKYPQHGKKKCGDLSSRTIYKYMRTSNEVLLPCCYPATPNTSSKKKLATKLSLLLKRKIRHMESQATIVNNRLIDLEMAVHGKEVDDKSNNLVS
jgi:hypothetical protein